MLKHNLGKKGNYVGLIRQILCATSFRCGWTQVLKSWRQDSTSLGSAEQWAGFVFRQNLPLWWQRLPWQSSGQFLPEESLPVIAAKIPSPNSTGQERSWACPRTSHHDSWLDIPGRGGGVTHFKLRFTVRKGFYIVSHETHIHRQLFNYSEVLKLALVDIFKHIQEQRNDKMNP